MSEYLAHLETKGRRASTITTARYRLLAFLRLTESDQPLAALTPALAAKLYARRVEEVRTDTHRGELALALACFAWHVKQGRMAANPFDGIEAVGERSRGKEQLRLDEARKFLACALAENTAAGDACALALLTGARASEVTDRIVRDLDDGGRLLWVPNAKTAAGIRQLPIPEILRARLLAHAAGKAPGDRLWGDITRHWLAHHVERLCKAAKVPTVSPHGLRGLYATVRMQQGAAAEAIARELGQAGPAVTRRHYFAPGSEEAVRAADLAERIAPPRDPDPTTN